MAGASYAVTSFLGGLWSKYAQGRFDLTNYRTALNECLNSLPVEQGAWVRRPGTQFAATTRKGAPGRVIRFDFKQSTPYTVEFTDGFLRFRNGPNLATTNDDQVVVSISTANPAKITTTTAHGWSSGNAVKFTLLSTTCPLLQNRIFTITVTSSTQFTLVDEITGATIDGSTLGVGSLAAAATVQRIQEVASPYVGTLWQSVRLVQAELQAVLLHPLVAPYVLTATAPPAGKTYYSFALAKANLLDGPYLDPPTNGALITPSGTSGVITLTLSFAAWSSTKAYSVGDLAANLGINYQSLTDQNQGNTPAGSPSNWTAVSAGLAIGTNGFVGSDVGRLIRLFNTNAWVYGKIVSIISLISPSLAGSTSIGNMTLGAGLAAAFDGVTSKTLGTSAEFTATFTDPVSSFVGKNYSGASAQKISSVTIWIPNDAFLSATKSYNVVTTSYQAATGPAWVQTAQSTQNVTVPTSVGQVAFNLRAKATAPASTSDGTLLGQVIATPVAGGNISIPSNDQTTSWNFVWVEVQVANVEQSIPTNFDGRNPNPPTASQVALSTQTYTLSYGLTSFAVSFAIAQLQFFNPSGTGSGTAATFQILSGGLPDTSTLSVWRLGAYSNTTGWPGCGTYHEGRLWLAGAIDNRIDASVSNQPFNFAPTSVTGTVTDASAITATFNASDVNAIFWLEPDQLGIVAGTQAGDWLIQATSNNLPLTPTSIQAHRYSKLGCANVLPFRMDRVLILVQRYRRKLYEYFADVFSGKFTAQNITWALRNLTKAAIAEIATQQELAPIIWVRCDDGSWFGITYKRESIVSSQPPNFAAGHRHTLGSGRTVESIAVGPSIDGNLDSLTMVTNDATSNIRHVEILTAIFEEGTAATSAWFLDDAIQPSSQTSSDLSTSNSPTPSPYGGLTVNGLWHLNNRTVSVFAGGIDCGDFGVSNGSITIPYGDGVSGGTGNGLFTPTLAATATIVIGFTYNSDGQLVRPATPQESGARTGPALGKLRRTEQFAVLLDNAAGISFGTDFTTLKPALFKTAAGVSYTTGQTFSGVYWDTLDAESDFDNMPCWRISRPYPATVVAFEAFLETRDK